MVSPDVWDVEAQVRFLLPRPIWITGFESYYRDHKYKKKNSPWHTVYNRTSSVATNLGQTCIEILPPLKRKQDGLLSRGLIVS